MTFPWLNGRTHYSIGESLADPEALVVAAKEAGLSSVMLCDTMTVSGMPELFTAAKAAGIKPMIAVRLRIVENLERERKPKTKPWFIKAMVLDDRGWAATLGLLSTAFQEDHFYSVPRLLLAEVIEAYRGGGAALALEGLSASLTGATARGVISAARDAGIPLYAEITGIPTPLAIRQAREALLLQDEGVPTLIAPPAFYASAEAADSLDLMKSVASNFGWDELSARHPYREHVVRNGRTIMQQTVEMKGALERRYGESDWGARLIKATVETRSFPDQVSFTWEKQAPSLPKMAEDEFQALTQICLQGWKTRLTTSVFGYVPEDLEPYKARLKYELGVIRKLGFSAYFLLVAEVVDWAKSQGVYVGPGRGSVGGSLIAYLMGITNVDPIRFNLLFERFINEERLDLPDADLDFASLRRDEVVSQITNRFGAEHVAGVVNYNTMQAAGALKDVCRMLSVDAGYAFSKVVPKEHGISWGLDDALAEVPELASFAEKHPEVIRHARHLEGRVRSFGKHAAGVIVAGVPIRERAVIERRNDAQVINWDKTTAEYFGLVKMDVLGLSTLDMLDIAVEHVKRMRGVKLDLLAIPLDDQKVLGGFGRGDTAGIFQMESAGARKMLKGMAQGDPLTFEDIVAANALNRPGPIDAGLVDQYIKRRNGLAPVHYAHPLMENALKSTYGVLVYQEQLMQVSKDLAGFTGPEADTLRKAVGKKDAKLMASMKDKFIEGAVAGGMERGAVEEFWRDVEGFAAYSFNRSHSVAYSLISYQCQYMKTYYPAEFWAGVLSMVKEDKRPGAIADMSRAGIKLLPPDVNDSTGVFTPLNDSVVLMPLNAVKGVSDKGAAAIVETRKTGRFTSIEDFAERVPGRACNSGAREKLNKVGAFCRVEPGQEPADHHSRRRDQVELLPGLIADAVVIDRPMEVNTTSLLGLTQIIEEYKACERCELKGLCHPKPMITGPTKAMLVLDGPNWKEESADEFGHGGHADAIEEALGRAGLSLDQVYITGLVKSPKPKGQKDYATKTLAECPAWLDEEIRILRPPLVVLMGSAAFKRFHPGLRGGLNEHTGKVTYDKARDCNVLVGMNANAIFYDPSKQDVLDKLMEQVAALLPAY